MVGAYGISGGTSQQDEVIAQHARAKVGWAHSSSEPPAESVKQHINELYEKAGIKTRL